MSLLGELFDTLRRALRGPGPEVGQHVYRCVGCDAMLDMHLNHVHRGWSAENGCAPGCAGTFAHPPNDKYSDCRWAGDDVHHLGYEGNDQPDDVAFFTIYDGEHPADRRD